MKFDLDDLEIGSSIVRHGSNQGYVLNVDYPKVLVDLEGGPAWIHESELHYVGTPGIDAPYLEDYE